MKRTVLRLVVLAAALCLAVSAGTPPAAAQGTPPPGRPKQVQRHAPHPGPQMPGEDRSRQIGQAAAPEQADRLVPQSPGFPDVYGYTFDNSVAYSWIDTSGGTYLSLSTECDQAVGVTLPFSFKYYENVYSSVYVGYTGFLSFAPASGCYYAQSVPSPEMPNNVIAPYFGDFANAPIQHVRYKAGGVAPNRYLAVEWHQVPDWYANTSVYTFEAVLYENGDILFQYQNMTYINDWACAGTGIEDAYGQDGLTYQWCDVLNAGLAIRFTRPAPAARVGIYPLNQGNFVHAGESKDFMVPIRNTGELGTDTFDTFPTAAWPVTLYAADGVTPLTDTNSNGSIDTGPVAQGETANVIARVQVPPGAVTGAHDHISLVVSSAMNTAKSLTADLATGIPSPFVQAYRDAPDNTMRLSYIRPGGQTSRKASPDSKWGYNMAVAETPSGNFVDAWLVARCLTQNCSLYTNEIEVALLDRYGGVVRSPSKVSDNSAAAYSTYDYNVSAAAAPSGQIALTWTREVYDNHANPSRWQYNIYFALLSDAGIPLYGPVNLTNNTGWSTDGNELVYNLPHVSATDDNRFAIAWEEHRYNGSQWQENIIYTVRNNSGGQVKAPTALTHATYGSGDGYYYPNVTQLSGSKAMLTFERGDDYGDIYFAVLDSAGNVVKGLTNLSNDGKSIWDWQTPAAAQLTDGRILIAWSAENYGNTPRYAVLNASYNLVSGPTMLTNPFAPNGNYGISVVRGQNGQGALTWTDDDYHTRNSLYYALVGQSGTVLTPPMIFYRSPTAADLETGWYGQGATTYTSSVQAVDGTVSVGSSLAGAQPGQSVQMRVRLANHGTGPLGPGSIPSVLTAQLSGGLIYASEDSGLAPNVTTNTITWDLPYMGFLDTREFSVWITVPATAVIGERGQVTLSLAVPGDANMTDNSATFSVMATKQDYMPVIRR